ncbi:CDP-alcohol phosphatidyltransferase-domain-containing protein [Phlyctochytrium arcticum]|nr:CDP-alcohol phosphatidyltransferase-domain-containing protein [Phlyctochytrium arcticum]
MLNTRSLLLKMFFPSKEEHVSDEALRNLRLYKYSSIDKSPISNYILKPYWEFCTTLFPMWIAPNLITLLGFFFVLANVAIALIYTPDLQTAGPSWIYFSFAAGMWLYSTFDNVDGKQARRTGSSSPLGELFDHGVDSLNCAFGTIVQAAGLGMGFSWYTVLLYAAASATFFCSTWENYHTGSLYLGYINGPTEGLIIACSLLIISGIFGPGFWAQKIETAIPALSKIIPGDLPLLYLFLATTVTMAVTTQIPVSIFRVYQARRNSNLPVGEAMKQLIPFTVYMLSTFLWIGSPFSTIMHNHIIAYIITTGLVFGRIATAIILAHVTHSPYPTYWTMLLPLVAGAIFTNLPFLLSSGPIISPLQETLYLYTFLVYAAISYLNWALCVIDRFCTYLGISCLKIQYRPVMARP